MQYPLEEKIGIPELFVGREQEFQNFGKWINNIPKKLSKSRVILARRKSGKTAFIQRIFNQLWNENGVVIPFYFEVAENKVWYPDFAIDYYRTFASQYISFLERDGTRIRKLLTLEEIKEYGRKHSIKPFVDDVNFFFQERGAGGFHGSMWKTAYSAPHVFAALYDKRFLVIIDEFQNLAKYIFRDEKCEGKPDETIPGSFHSVVESKIAPMLVTGSYVSWLIEISGKYLEAGRLSEWYMSPYLTPEEGLQAVYKYAQVYNEPVTNETAAQINQLCMSDPFFISCVIQSNYPNRDLTTEDGVINTVNYEITDRRSEMSRTWSEYIQLTLHKVNDRHAKKMLLHLSQNSDRYWTPRQLKDKLKLELELDDIQKKLLLLVEADVIEWGSSDIDFRGLQDGTLNLILRNRFEKEIEDHAPDLKQDFQQQVKTLMKDKRRLQGMLNHLAGIMAEYLLAREFRSRQRFSLSDFFDGVSDRTELNIIDVRERVTFQRENGKQMEIDVKAESSCGRVILVEVKKIQVKTGLKAVEDFQEKITAYSNYFPEKTILPAFLSLGGFTDEARQFCNQGKIGIKEEIEFFKVN